MQTLFLGLASSVRGFSAPLQSSDGYETFLQLYGLTRHFHQISADFVACRGSLTGHRGLKNQTRFPNSGGKLHRLSTLPGDKWPVPAADAQRIAPAEAAAGTSPGRRFLFRPRANNKRQSRPPTSLPRSHRSPEASDATSQGCRYYLMPLGAMGGPFCSRRQPSCPILDGTSNSHLGGTGDANERRSELPYYPDPQN